MVRNLLPRGGSHQRFIGDPIWIPPFRGRTRYAVGMPNKERSRDNTFLDRETRRWRGPILLIVLALIAGALVVMAILR
jgi:hypothetical protein